MEIMNLAELKRFLTANVNKVTLEMIDCSFPNRLLNIPRKLVMTNTVDFALWTERRDGSWGKSYMRWPKATELENAGKTGFTIRDELGFFTYSIQPISN
jgi:hypothetical protein